MSASQSATAGLVTGGERRNHRGPQKCAFCKNHGIVSLKAGHKMSCELSKEAHVRNCIPCGLLRSNQKVQAVNTQVSRQTKPIRKKNADTPADLEAEAAQRRAVAEDREAKNREYRLQRQNLTNQLINDPQSVVRRMDDDPRFAKRLHLLYTYSTKPVSRKRKDSDHEDTLQTQRIKVEDREDQPLTRRRRKERRPERSPDPKTQLSFSPIEDPVQQSPLSLVAHHKTRKEQRGIVRPWEHESLMPIRLAAHMQEWGMKVFDDQLAFRIFLQLMAQSAHVIQAMKKESQ